MGIETAPAVADECRYKQQQSRFGLVEIGDDRIDYPVPEAGCYYNPGACTQGVFALLLQLINYRLKRIHSIRLTVA